MINSQHLIFFHPFLLTAPWSIFWNFESVPSFSNSWCDSIDILLVYQEYLSSVRWWHGPKPISVLARPPGNPAFKIFLLVAEDHKVPQVRKDSLAHRDFLDRQGRRVHRGPEAMRCVAISSHRWMYGSEVLDWGEETVNNLMFWWDSNWSVVELVEMQLEEDSEDLLHFQDLQSPILWIP